MPQIVATHADKWRHGFLALGFVNDPFGYQHILLWGGLRGAVALALALGFHPEVPHRDNIVTISFAVVAFSVFVQGLTIKWFLRRMGAIPQGGRDPGDISCG